MIKIIKIIKSIITVLLIAAGAYILNKYEYLGSFGDIDNIVGMVPVALISACAAGACSLLWMKRAKKFAPVSAALAVLVILSAALFPNALRGNWWINPVSPDPDSNLNSSEPDLSLYAPFFAGPGESKLAKLGAGDAAELNLTGYLPVLDGATALYPVYSAFAEAVYNQNDFTPDKILCTNTRGAYDAIISGERDIIFVAGASQRQLAAAEAAGADLRFTPIGREAFVFIVGKNNPVDNLTYRQIRNIYSGKTGHWGTLGWRGGGKIIAFQRPDGSGSQTGLQLYMGAVKIQVPQPLPGAGFAREDSLMRQVAVEWRGVQPAIGYSYRYYATAMYANPGVKLLKIDGTEPSVENIQNGKYIFAGDFYAVTNGEPEGNTKLLIEWVLSRQGQELIKKTGYSPIILY